MQKPDEQTSAKVAKKAAKVLRMTDAEVVKLALADPGLIRSLAASALTQAPDHDEGAETESAR